MAEQNFLSPQVIEWVVISNKLPKDLRLRNLGNQKNQENLKSSQNYFLLLGLLPKGKFCQY